MKNTLILFVLLLSLNALCQEPMHPEQFKSQQNKNLKGDINLYYNPVMDKYDLFFVKLDLEVSDQSTFIKGSATLYAKATQTLDTLLFEFSEFMTVDSMLINGYKVPVNHNNNELKFIFNTPLTANEKIKTQIFYHGTPDPDGRGVTNDYDSQWNKDVTWTLSESFHAMEWWPCKQVLSDKIDSTYIFLTCDDDCMAGSNGLLTQLVELPNNKKRFEWKTYYPMSYYLLSFAVSEYQDYSIYAKPKGVDSVLIQNFVYDNPNYLAGSKEIIDQTIGMLELFSDKFGLYPFANEKYGHCLTTLGGGMEHQTMTTIGNFSEEWYNIISHELGHMWFGDYVTCATWQDIWINEGFASYTEYIALENLRSFDDAQSWMRKTHNYALEESNFGIYIPFEDAGDESFIFYFRLSYKKGAAIIHMLRHEINNDDLFFSSLQNFLSEYGDSVATGDDFKNSLEASTEMEFDSFFDQWYYGKGYPHFDVSYKQSNDTLIMTVTQTTTSPETPLFQLNVDYKLTHANGDTTVRLYQSKNIETFQVPIKEKITNIVVDPDNWIVDYENTNAVKTPKAPKPLFSFSPNPANENIRVGFSNNRESSKLIDIYDLNGRLIKSYQTNNSDYIIDISYLAPGIYIIKGTSGNIFSTHKLIKR